MTDTKNLLLPVLVAAGSGLSAMPASALQLADMKVHSTLGQPLRASIAYALNPNEHLASNCVSLQSAMHHNGVPVVSSARVSVENGLIRLTGTSPVSEPIVSVRVNVQCPYTPRLSREFTLFIDPAGTMQAEPAPVAVAAVRRSPMASQASATVAPARAPSGGVDGPGTDDRYFVQPGDTLTGIAARLRTEKAGMWAVATQIHAANPHAFIDNDPNRLRAGVWLSFPEFVDREVFVATPAVRQAAPAAVAAPPSQGRQDAAAAPTESPAGATLAKSSVAVAAPQPAERVMSGMAIGVAKPPVERESTQLVDETIALPGGATPNVPIARIEPADTSASTIPGTLWWLVGAGAVLIAGLLSLMRRSGAPVAPSPAEPANTHPLRRETDTRRIEAIVADDYALSDDSPTAENLALDADLELGSGLGTGVDIAVTEDFGFSTSAELDLELPDERGTTQETGNLRQTDIIAAPQRDESSILESEILPDDDDYDMSVVMDVTKMPDTDAVTERDLKAVVVDDGDPTMHDSYTISQEPEYEILEQDYEEELSATQALNLEIERAAAELAERMDAEIAAENEEFTPTSENTALLPLASVTRLEPSGRGAKTGDSVEVESGAEGNVSHEDITTELPTSKDSKAG